LPTRPAIPNVNPSMKNLAILATAFIALSGLAAADIHAPPQSQYTSVRKLSRGLSNIIYGIIEIPEQMVRKQNEYGRKAEWSYGLVDGTNRSLKRLGYGFYEVFTFTCPTYRGTFKPPYQRCGEDNRVEMNVADGLSEFPPELGFDGGYYHSRTQKF
jgi:putative exosortase-associated protein (TIGR04073 family)